MVRLKGSTKGYYAKTRSAVFWTSLCNEPLVSIYPFLPFILHKEIAATPFQLALFVMVKPVVSLLSLYWSFQVSKRRDRLLGNVVWGGVLARLPFFCIPFVSSAWAVIAIAALYWLLYRGMAPAWMEILRLNIPGSKRSSIFSQGSILGYLEGILLAVAIGPIMDANSQAWRWLFPAAALLGVFGSWLQSRLPIKPQNITAEEEEAEEKSLRDTVMLPWYRSWELLKSRPDFARFQWAFFVCGGAIMLMKPAEPIFCEILGLSYTNLAIAILVCKGIGFIATSTLWARFLARTHIYVVTGAVCLFVALSYLMLLAASVHITFFYLSFVLYGVWQAGSHLCWHLSGPIFAKNEDSSLFSGVNVVTVGIRGLIGPVLGGICLTIWGAPPVLWTGVVIAAMMGIRVAFSKEEEKVLSVNNS